MDTTNICKWGNSATIRLPVEVMKASKLEIGSRITIEVLEEGTLLLKPIKTTEPDDAATQSQPR